jgi:ribosomal protein L11 methyltransferase
MAFGTGTHPTTRLCLELVEGILRSDILRSAQDDKGMAEDDRKGTVIDLGCGSGILSVAALKLGARGALGVDIDPDAIRVAGENAELNQVADRFEAGLGSLDEIRAGAFSFQQAGLVLANILAPVLVRMLDEGLGELVSPGGALVLSGIIDEQVGEVIAAAERNGLRLVDQKQDGDWVAIRFAKRSETNTGMGS